MRRAILISSTAVYGIPEKHPIEEDDPLVGVGHYGESKIDAEQVTGEFGRRGLDVVVLRPKTFIGPERLGVFEILFDWIREGRRIYVLGDGSNRYQLLAVEDLVDAVVRSAEADAAGETVNVGARDFGTVRDDLEALIAHAGSSQPRDARSGPAGGAGAARAWSSPASRRSPSGTTRRRIATPSSTSPRPSACSAGARGSRTPRR